MKSFLRKLLAAMAIQLLIAGLLWWRYQPDTHSYMAATIDKHARLRQLDGPRLILVGGSNVALGLSAEQLSGALDKPAVNMGLHANLVRDFMLAEVHDALRSGDVVLLSFEYQAFAADPSPITLAQLLEVRPASLTYVPVQLAPRFTDDGLIMIGQRARRTLIQRPAAVAPYSRDSFNMYGDAEGHHGMPQRLPLRPFYLSGFDGDSVEVAAASIEVFARHAASLGAKVYYSHPPLPAEVFADHAEAIATVAARVDHIADVTVVNAPTSLPSSCFFDTAYHLSELCTQRRTAGLIELMSTSE